MKIVETFECSDQNLSNFLCQFQYDKSIPLQVLYPSSVSWKIIRLYFFSSNSIYFAQLKRSSLKWKLLRLLSAQIKICQISYVNFNMTSRFLSKFCITLQFHERLFACTVLAQKIYTLFKRSPLKWKFWDFSSSQVKTCQIPYANF